MAVSEVSALGTAQVGDQSPVSGVFVHVNEFQRENGFNTWLVQGNAQIHPEGAYPGGHEWESLRVESLGREGLVLVLWRLSPCLL